MKKKNIFILLAIILILGIVIFFLFFYDNTAKNLKIGNNSTSQEKIEYILNISSYQATVQVEVESNKDQNQYVIKQEYKKPDNLSQEVLEPSNIAGVKMIKNGNQLKIENTKLNLSSIFENYEPIVDNNLDLSSFIKDYQADAKSSWKEEGNQIVMNTKTEQEEKTLWLDKTDGKPKKLEIKRTNKNTKIYILYNEVNLNSLK